MVEHEWGRRIDVSHAAAVQIGNHNVQNNWLIAPHAVARSRYLSLVRHRHMPETLVGRQAELEVLSRFCAEPNGRDYLYWKAEFWSGKTALLAWFVLHPPAHTCVVSFFINSDSYSQNNRHAFLDVVTEQLAEQLGEPAPRDLPPAARESVFLGMIEEVAERCARQSIRLVLVVDGLDEDAVVDGASVAALLPSRPVHGTRVIVAGRPHPPLPTDVPGTHPLRDTSNVRLLPASQYAQGIRHAAERELALLMRNAEARDVLRLITVARGRLSCRDLAELTGRDLWQIENLLSGPAGRTFAREPAAAWPGLVGAPELLVLSHSQLREAAAEVQGGVLDAGRKRLCEWADSYRAAGWPENTPEYLLREYVPMLREVGDLARMVSCGLDEVRHDRLLAVSGTSSIAVAEVTAVQRAVAQQTVPDVPALVRLGFRVARLTRRSSFIPPSLPAVWVLAGQPSRGAELLWAMPDKRDRRRAQDALAEVLDRHGARERIVTFADLAVAGARNDALAGWKVAEWAGALARSTDDGEAERFIERHTDLSDRQRVREHFAELQAETEILKWGLQFESIHHAAALNKPRLNKPSSRDEGLLRKARERAQAGNIRGAEDLARRIQDSAFQAWSLIDAVTAAIRADDVAAATTVALTIPTPRFRAYALALVALAAVESGDAVTAKGLARQAEGAAHSVAQSLRKTSDLADIAVAFADAGRYDYAADVANMVIRKADSCHDAEDRDTMICDGIRALAAAGCAERAEQLAEAVAAPALQEAVSGYAARAWIAAGDVEHARDLVFRAALPEERMAVLEDSLVDFAGVWSARAACGNHMPAVGERLERIAKTVVDPNARAFALSKLALGWARAKQHDRAEAAADAAVFAASEVDEEQALGLVVAAEVLRVRVITGRGRRHWESAHQVEAAAWAFGDVERGAEALETMVQVWTELGNTVHAERLAERLREPAKSLAYIAAQGGGVKAQSLMARAVMHGGPHAANSALARLNPNALLEIASELAGDVESSGATSAPLEGLG